MMLLMLLLLLLNNYLADVNGSEQFTVH